jgi:hypothetical protein
MLQKYQLKVQESRSKKQVKKTGQKTGPLAESMSRIGGFAGESAGVDLLHPRGENQIKPL